MSQDNAGGVGRASSVLPPFAFLPDDATLRWTPCVVVSAEADASGELLAAITAVRETVTCEASWSALVCLALEELAVVVCRMLPDSVDAMARVSRCLASLAGPTAAARHLQNWRKCRRLYAAREDREFWNQLLRSPAFDTRLTGFSMSLLMFLHTEYDAIAVRWATREARHALWQEVYLCGYQLPVIIRRIGDILAKHRVDAGGEGDATVFHATAQRIYEQQQQQQRRVEVGAIVDHAAAAAPCDHATALRVYDTEARAPVPRLEAEYKSAPAAAEEAKDESERECEPQRQSHAKQLRQPDPPDGDEAMPSGADDAATAHIGGTGASRPTRILRRNRVDDEGEGEDHKSEESSLHEASRSIKRRRKSAAPSVDEVQIDEQKQGGGKDADVEGGDAAADAPAIGGGEYLFSPAEALEPIALTRPLETPLPFHPSVRAHMSKFGIAIVTPAFCDQLSLLQSLEPRALQPQNYGHAYRMSLGCFNRQEEVDQAAMQAAIGAEAAVQPRAPVIDQVLAFLEQQWTHMRESNEPDLPRLAPTENCVYVKDVAAAQDAHASSPAASDTSDGASRLSFLPKFDRVHAELMQQLQDVEDDQEQQQEAEAEEGEDTPASDDPETRRYLRTAKLRLDSLSVACASAYKRRGGSSRSSPPVAYHFHPLYQDEISLHPESLARLSPNHFTGIENAFAYLKRSFQHFNLHLEQMLLTFLHQQLCGESLWIVIPHSERDKLAAAIAEMVETRARWMQRHHGGDAVVVALDQGVTACLSQVAFHAKNLFPPLSLLAKHDVRYYRVTLKAGQVLTAHGGFSHFGFNTSKSETSSLASNMLTEEWFLTGGPEFLVRHFQWVGQMQAIDEQHQHQSLDSMLQARGLTTAQLADALNVCPPAYACSLLRGMQADLRLHALGRGEECVGAYTMSLDQTQAVLAQLTRARALLHQVRPFMRKYYVDPGSDLFQVCECSESEGGESPHSPIDDAPAPMDEEDDAETQIQSAQVRRRHAGARSKRLPSSSDEEEKSGAPAAGAKPSAVDAAQRTSAMLRKLDMHLASLQRLRHAPPDALVSSAQYTRISTNLMRCWYASVSLALGVDTFWRIHQAIQDAVAAVPDIGVATALGFPGAHAAGADLTQLKRSFLRSADFEAARWGSDMEMHLLSYAYRGALSFLVYREGLPDPTFYRYSGVGARPTALVETALHWCPSRRRRRERGAPEPNHYNLLQYTIAGRLQPFWWVAGETESHKETRHEHLRAAAREAQ